MTNVKNEKYDVVIIGAGIGGLVCGCYLAKAGLKVLIVEQHSIPGGCCTSFKRNGYTFDTGVHYVGSLREEGILRRIIVDLNLESRINFLRNDPTDKIVMPHNTLFIRKEKEDTIQELISNFPKEKENIIRFFKFILETDFLVLFAKLRDKTFKQLLDGFFEDYQLKASLSVLLGNLGLPASRASALVCAVLFIEYILDGGYYPQGGVQKLPDLLADRFKEFGGNMLVSKKAIKIKTENKVVSGVLVENEGFFASNYVVSNVDVNLTLNCLLDIDTEEKERLPGLEESQSAFVVYWGLSKELNLTPSHFTTWLFNTYDVDSCYGNPIKGNVNEEIKYLLITFASSVDKSLAPKGKSTLRVFSGARFEKKTIWDSKKDEVLKKIKESLQSVIPGFEKTIEEEVVATPATFQRYTSNYNGALFGWAALPSQVGKLVFPAQTSLPNLFLTGHWVTNGVGQSSVSLVAMCGKNTALMLLHKDKSK